MRLGKHMQVRLFPCSEPSMGFLLFSENKSHLNWLHGPLWSDSCHFFWLSSFLLKLLSKGRISNTSQSRPKWIICLHVPSTSFNVYQLIGHLVSSEPPTTVPTNKYYFEASPRLISSINVLVHVCLSEREALTLFETEAFSHLQTNHSNKCSLMSLVSQSSSFQSSHKFDSVSSLLLFVFSAWPHWPPGYFLAFLMMFCFRAFAQAVHTAQWAPPGPLPLPGWARGAHSHRPLLKHHSYCREERQDHRLLGTPFVL